MDLVALGEKQKFREIENLLQCSLITLIFAPKENKIQKSVCERMREREKNIINLIFCISKFEERGKDFDFICNFYYNIRVH